MTKRSLVDPDRYIGTATVIGASTIQANLPKATARAEKRALAKGAVGDFVFIDCETVKLLGRIIEVKVPDAERLFVEPALGSQPEPHPIGRIQLLASVDQKQEKLLRGLRAYPRVGDAVYRADPAMFGELMANSLSQQGDNLLDLGFLDAGSGIRLKLPPEKLFGRHCGVFGATGGGKSWTLAALLNQIKTAGGKCILFDPTGEFADVSGISRHYAFDTAEAGTTQVHFPFSQMTEDDLFALFRPAGQTQGPKLREAIRSLKLVRAANGNTPAEVVFFENRLVTKRNRPRAPFFQALGLHRAAIQSPFCNFNIGNLADQLHAECVYASDRDVQANWGRIDDQAVGYCEGLIARIRMLIHSSELACLFGTAGQSLATVLDQFFNNETDDIIRISFKNVRFEHNTREILLNVIGRFLLSRARENTFRDKPMITLLDEAHQFLGRTVGDEYGNVRLEAFGLIAKEGRKYGLTTIMATQRPRDIPADVISQLGTLIVHRLTNDEDRHAVERACGDLDREAALFIPTLAPGEAIVVGPDLPAPVPVLIHEPPAPPNSKGPNYTKFWATRKKPAEA
ncbi:MULTISPECIES: ATP-binding protein [Rhizobium]|uniref:ATP-binding protein n=1 Tax=Rhizobium TaxID=379 RepID=UPI00103172C2|nr:MULTISPECIES: ATP-binding protein [Rhizobium]TBF24865.1 ATP-binding protein [Rhizobium leguminosarum]WSH48580.1 ATP-binding protein [Rhizobium johnstonii]